MRTPNRRQALGAGLTVTALAGLSACGGGAVGAIDAGDPVKGGTLRVGVTGGNSADTVDAHIPVNNGDVCRAVNLYNALYGWDDDSQVVPLLAESFEANDDSTVWTCTLKQGIKFSDGSRSPPRTSSSRSSASPTPTTRRPRQRTSPCSTRSSPPGSAPSSSA